MVVYIYGSPPLYLFAPKGHFEEQPGIAMYSSRVSWGDNICYAAWENGWGSVPSVAAPAFGDGRRLPWARPNPWRNFGGRTSIVVGAVLL